MVKGPSIIRYVNKMYKEIVSAIGSTGVDIPEDQVPYVKLVLCQQIRAILVKEHLYCMRVFSEALPKDAPYWSAVIEGTEKEIGAEYRDRFLALERKCKTFKTPPSA